MHIRVKLDMSATETLPTLDRLLEPVTWCPTPDALRELIDLRADVDLQERLETLADKNTEGQLTVDEREKYETYVRAIHVVSILQAKARLRLAVGQRLLSSP
jgi:hypothetical protein